MSNFYNKTGVQALEEMHSSSCGLSAGRSRQKSRRQLRPLTSCPRAKRKALPRCLPQFKDLLVIILIVAALISAVSDNLESTIVIFAVLILNAILGTVQYVKAEKSLESLKAMSQPTAKVIRNGSKTIFPR